MILVSRKHTKALIGVVLSVFLFVSFLGVAHADMTMGPDGQMSSNCPFMPGMATLCQMNPFEHIAAWQGMFTAVPNQNDILTILFLLAFALGVTLLVRANWSMAPPKTLASQSSFTYYKRYIPIMSPLQEAFSDGILHPKLF